LVWEVANDTALLGDNNGMVDNLEEVGGYPDLFTNWALKDTDGDGIPDFWELENGLDPNDAEDNHTIIDGKTYPAIEEFMNGIVASNSKFMFPPTQLNAELTEIKEISLAWQDNSEDETSYLVWRSEGDVFKCIDTLPANTTFCTDTNIVFDRTYTYKLQAINEADSSVFSNEAEASTLGADRKPKPADNPVPSQGAANMSTTINLSWSQGVGAKSHNVYLGTTSSPAFLANVASANYTISNLNHNTRYYWRVDEVNENGATEGTLWNFMTRNEFPADLIAHFSFNQPISVNDISGNGITGTPYNVNTSNFVEGISGKAIQFDGSTQYCEYPHNEKINFDNNSFTLTFWIKQDLNTVNKSNSHRYIVKGSNVKNQTQGHSGKRYEVYYTPDKQIFRFCIDDDAVKSEVTADENLFLTNSWVHVAAVRDTTEKKLFLYANAQLVGQVPDVTGNIAQNEALYLSYCVDEAGYVDGIMDEVQLYGYALSPEQIDSLYTINDTISDTVTIENVLIQGFQLYPNPTSGKITILSPSSKNIQSLTITDLVGRILYQKLDVATGSIVELNLTSLAKQGQQLLIVAVRIEEQVFFQKLIIN
jgi:hypothetical protein